jgi:putative membrane protein
MDNKEPILDDTSSIVDDTPKDAAPVNFMEYVFFFLRGMAMGAADVVPGVSGGTIAFITGIYERLLNAIKSVNPTAFRLLFKEGILAAWKYVDGSFLASLFAGIVVSLVSLSKILKWCLEAYPQLLFAFFFGLIIASSIYIIRQVKEWNPKTILSLLIGAAIAYTITVLVPTEAPNTYWMIFLSGMIAISAMILPGISGSFILLLMGMYRHVLNAATSLDIVFLLIFIAGCLIGLLSFSHVLSWVFKNYKNTALAILSGFMIGSLNKVWPWQNVLKTRLDSHGNEVPWIRESVLPANYGGDTYILYCVLLLILGFSIVFVLERLGKNSTEG